MALKICDMVAMTGTVTGTDDVQLVAALDGFRDFATAGVVDSVDSVPYRMETDDGTIWETGIALYYTSGGAPYLSRYSDNTVAFPVASSVKVYLTAPSWMYVAVNKTGSGTAAQERAPQANSAWTTAAGSGATAEGERSAAFGCTATANGIGGVALGYGAVASGVGSVALGRDSVVSGCAAIGRGSNTGNTENSGLLIWTGAASAAGNCSDAGGSRFKLPNVKCIAILDVLVVAAWTGLSDSYAARATLVLQRSAVNATIAIVGTPVVTTIKDDSGAAALSFSVYSSGALSALEMNIVENMYWNAVITASVRQLS